MGKHFDTYHRFGIRTQLMGLLVLFFLLLAFLTTNTVKEQLRDMDAFEQQKQLLDFAIQTHNIAYQIYTDKIELEKHGNAQTVAISETASFQKILAFQDTAMRPLMKRHNLESFPAEEITSLRIDETRAPLKVAITQLSQLQKTALKIHKRIIELLISLNLNNDLVKTKNLSEVLHLYYTQKILVDDGLLKQVDLKLLFEILETVKKEHIITPNSFNIPDDNPNPYEEKLNTLQQVENLLEKRQLLTDLDKHLGYDGFIHNFKNLVIRGPSKYEHSTRIRLLNTIRTIDYLSIQHSLSSQSRIGVINIRSVILDYAKSLETVIEEWKKGTPVKEIDRMIRVDDSTAIEAMAMLHKNIYQLGLESLSKDIDTKIVATYQATNETYKLLAHTFSQQSNTLRRNLYLYISIAAAGSAILFIIVAKLTQRLITRITHIKKVLHHLESHTDLDIKVEEDSKDEIGDIATLLNKAIKHRQKIESSLENQTKKAQQAAQAKSKFLSGMSHEMKTPLNSIIGYSQRLLTKRTDTDSREYDAIETIFKNGQRLLERVDHILKLVDIEDSQRSLDQHTRITHLHQAFKNLVFLRSEATTQLHWNIEDSNLNLAGPDDWISDIAKHLCAPENFPDESPVDIEVFTKNEHCFINVTFEKPNANQEEIESLFHETQGLIDPTHEAHEGSHLNLAIVKSIIDHLNGSIEAKFEAGKVTYYAKLNLVWSYSI